MRALEGDATDRAYRRMTGVRGVPPGHSVVLCGVERGGNMATASGVDFADARERVDLRLDAMHETDPEEAQARESVATDWPGGPIFVNDLNATALAQTAGISEKLAAAVVKHRQAHGPFRCGPDLGCVQHEDRDGLMVLAARADYRTGAGGTSV